MKLSKNWKHKVTSLAVLATVSLCGIGEGVSALAANSPTAGDIVKVPDTITSNVFYVDQSIGCISKITAGTSVDALWANLAEKDYVAFFDKDGNSINGSAVLGTGMTATIMDEGTEVKRYSIVVTGDTNGDGKINITDMIAVKACTLKKSGLSGVYEKAGDVNGDGKINITDFIKVKATTLKKDTITGVEVK